MSDEYTRLRALVADCKSQARAMADAASGILSQEEKTEFLHLATAWLKLADEIEALLLDL